MESTVYIEAINNFPSDDWSCSAFLGCRSNGSNIKLFEDIDEVPLNRYTVLIASIENTHKWMEGMDWKIPKSMTIPEELHHPKFLGRTIIKMFLGEALNLTRFPYFIKSYELKKFIPGVITSEKDKKWFNSDKIGQDEVVLVSDVLDFISEYRIYVLDSKMIGCYYYNGDFKYYPDLELAEEIIKEYTEAPKFYSIDLGITSNKETFLIECNDGYSLGNYGLSPKLYTRGLISRWRQLLEQNPVKL